MDEIIYLFLVADICTLTDHNAKIWRTVNPSQDFLLNLQRHAFQQFILHVMTTIFVFFLLQPLFQLELKSYIHTMNINSNNFIFSCIPLGPL